MTDEPRLNASASISIKTEILPRSLNGHRGLQMKAAESKEQLFSGSHGNLATPPPTKYKRIPRQKNAATEKVKYWQLGFSARVKYHFQTLTRLQKVIYAAALFLLLTGGTFIILWNIGILPWFPVRDPGSNASSSSTSKYSSTTIFNTDGIPGFIDGDVSVAKFNQPAGCVADSQGNIYVADSANGAIRIISSNNVVSTIVSNNQSHFSKRDSSAVLILPTGLALDGFGILYVTDYGDNSIKTVDTVTGTIKVLAGSGRPGFNNGPPLQSSFNKPRALFMSPQGLLIADYGNNMIRLLNSTGILSKYAGGGSITSYGIVNPGSFSFPTPASVVTDSEGKVYVLDMMNSFIRMINVRTSEISEVTDKILSPSYMAIDVNDNLYVTGSDGLYLVNTTNSFAVIQLVKSTGVSGVALVKNGTIVVTDTARNSVSLLTSSVSSSSNDAVNPVIPPLFFSQTSQGSLIRNGGFEEHYNESCLARHAGDCMCDNMSIIAPWKFEYLDSKASYFQFELIPSLFEGKVALDINSNVTDSVLTQEFQSIPNVQYVISLQLSNYHSCSLSSTSMFIQIEGMEKQNFAHNRNPLSFTRIEYVFAAVSNVSRIIIGSTTGNECCPIIDDIRAELYNPTSLPSGIVSTSSLSTGSIIVIPATSTTKANGNPTSTKSSAQIAAPTTPTIKTTIPLATSTPIVTSSTIFNKERISGFIDGDASVARFNQPAGCVADSQGRIYVADTLNGAIRIISSNNVVSTLVRRNLSYLSNQNSSIGLINPMGLSLDSKGLLYVTDIGDNSIKIVNIATGAIKELVKSGANGANLNKPLALFMSFQGLLIADSGNYVIRRFNSTGVISTYFTLLFNRIPGEPLPAAVVMDSKGIVYVADARYSKISIHNGSSTMVIDIVPSPTSMTIDKNDNVYVTGLDGLYLINTTTTLSVTQLVYMNMTGSSSVALTKNSSFVIANSKTNWVSIITLSKISSPTYMNPVISPLIFFQFAQNNLIQNGGFENHYKESCLTANSTYCLSTNMSNIAPWAFDSSTKSYTYELDGTVWEPFEGKVSIDLCSDNQTVLAQEFETVANARYLATFQLSANPHPFCGNYLVTSMYIQVVGSPNSTHTHVHNVSIPMFWEKITYPFTASSNVSRLLIGATSGSSCGSIIDDVRVVPFSTNA